MLDKPVIIKDVLDIPRFSYMNEVMHRYMLWTLTNISYSEGTPSWGVRDKTSEIIFYDAASIIKLKCLRYMEPKVQLVKLHYNGQTSGQMSEFHGDFEYKTEKLSWTFVLFTELLWNTQWGGEFVCQHPDTKEYFYTPYVPNTGVLIPAWWQHCGNPPFPCTDKIRTTVAFSYMEWDTLNSAESADNCWDTIKKFV